MKGFSSLKDFTRYGNLYALSCLLSNESFWFNGDLYDACESKDIEKLQRSLISAYPPIREFVFVIDWEKLAESASVIWKLGNDEHNRLIERLGLLGGEV
jgi:hypothetical protein